MSRLLIPLLTLFAFAFCGTAAASDGSAVVDWNRIALQTTAQAPFNPPRETRSLAIVQAAVLDSVTSITRARPPYLVRISAPRGASVPAAVAGAAHATLVALYPEQRAALDAQYAAARPSADGAAVGEAVAAAVLALRAQDGADVLTPAPPVSGLGAWVPTPPAFRPALEPGWGRVTPFLLRSGSALRPPPPPAVGSRRYARDLREIEAVGSIDSTVRTADQTEAARFWVATAPSSGTRSSSSSAPACRRPGPRTRSRCSTWPGLTRSSPPGTGSSRTCSRAGHRHPRSSIPTGHRCS